MAIPRAELASAVWRPTKIALFPGALPDVAGVDTIGLVPWRHFSAITVR